MYLGRANQGGGVVRSVLILLLKLGDLSLGLLLDERVQVLATVVAEALVERVHKLGQLLLVKVLLDDHVVRHGSVFKPKFELLQICVRPQQLATQVLYGLVRLLRSQLGLTQGKVRSQVGHLHA